MISGENIDCFVKQADSTVKIENIKLNEGKSTTY